MAEISSNYPRYLARVAAAVGGGAAWSWAVAGGFVLLLALAGAFVLRGGALEGRAVSAATDQAAQTAQGSSASSDQPQKVDGQKPAWSVTCLSSARLAPPDCKIEQRLLVRETGRTLSLAVVDVPGTTRKPVLWLQLPNAIALQTGVSLVVDNGAVAPVPVQSCDGNGCYASMALSDRQIAAMQAGSTMEIRAATAGGQPLIFRHLLADFATAYGAAK